MDTTRAAVAAAWAGDAHGAPGGLRRERWLRPVAGGEGQRAWHYAGAVSADAQRLSRDQRAQQLLHRLANCQTQRANLTSTQQQVLDIFINTELLQEQLDKQHIAVPQKAIQTARDSLNSQIATSRKQLEQSPDPALKAMVDAITPDVIDLLAREGALQSLMQEKGKLPSVHLRGIDLKDQQTAQQMQQKAESGSDFAALARANSLNTTTGAQGGEIGTIFIGQVTPEFDKAVFAPGAHPGKYVILPIQGSYWLFELTNLGPEAVSTISDSQTQAATVSSWLDEVVRPAASIEEYVTIG